MTDRPTPETDAFFRTFVHGQAAPSHAEYYDRMRLLERERDEARDTIADVLSALNPMHNEGPRLAALRVKEERDEARDAAEKAKAYKRVMKEDNAKLRRELDELNKRLIEVCQYGVVCTIEREDLRKELAELKEARNGPER